MRLLPLVKLGERDAPVTFYVLTLFFDTSLDLAVLILIEDRFLVKFGLRDEFLK